MEAIGSSEMPVDFSTGLHEVTSKKVYINLRINCECDKEGKIAAIIPKPSRSGNPLHAFPKVEKTPRRFSAVARI
jgi:hypothetical protein